MQARARLAWAWIAAAVAVAGAGCMDFDDHDTWTESSGGRSLRVAVRSDPVFVAAGETLDGDLVVVGGEAQVDGEVRGDLVVVAGRLRVGPAAVVGRDLVAVGNEVTDVARGARIGRSQIAVNFPGVRWMVENALLVWDNPLLTLLVALLGTGILLWLAYRVLIKKYDPARFHGTVEHHPVRAGMIGLMVHVVFGALALAAFLGRWTIGLAGPLIMGGFLLGGIGWVMGAVHVGRLLAERRGWTVGPFSYGMAGFGIVAVASCVPILGQLGAFILSLVGVGAMVLPSRVDELPAGRGRAPSVVPPPAMPPKAPPRVPTTEPPPPEGGIETTDEHR